MIRLDLKHLEMIRTIARAGSVSAAAERLGVSQSALSHRIREAERRLGTPLFFRENRRLVLTSVGKRMLQAADSALGEVERAEAEVEKLGRGVRHVVRFAAAGDTPFHWLPVFYQMLMDRAPEIDMEIVTEGVSDPAIGLEDNLFDLTVASGPVGASGVEVRTLGRDEMVAVMAAGDALAGKPELTPRHFADAVYIARHTLPERGREYELFFRRHDILPARVIQAGTSAAVLELVRSGLGVTIMPRWAVEPYLQGQGLVTVPLGPDLVAIDWNLMFRRKEAVGSAVRKASALIEEAIRL